MRDEAAFRVKTGLAEMLKGWRDHGRDHPRAGEGAENAGAAAVMVLERVPADIRDHVRARCGPPGCAARAAGVVHGRVLKETRSPSDEGAMRRALYPAAGLTLTLVGLMWVIVEVDRGQDIWRRHSAVGLVVAGVLMLMHWASQR
jgi:hypothetical protein